MSRKYNLVALIFWSTIASAGTMGPIGKPCPTTATIPCACKAWEFGAKALFLQPTYTNGQAYISSGGVNQSLNQPMGVGFELEGAYHFSTGNALEINWTHYDVSRWHNGYSGTTPEGTAPYSLDENNWFDQVNVLFKQHWLVSPSLDGHFLAGLQYADLKHNQENNFNPIADHTYNQFNNVSFYGVGPVLGISGRKALWWQGVSLIASSKAGLLYGKSRQETGTVLNAEVVTTSTYASKELVTPYIDALIALQYGFNNSFGQFEVSVGYQAMNYINTFALVTTTAPAASSNVALAGPYVGLVWRGEV